MRGIGGGACYVEGYGSLYDGIDGIDGFWGGGKGKLGRKGNPINIVFLSVCSPLRFLNREIMLLLHPTSWDSPQMQILILDQIPSSPLQQMLQLLGNFIAYLARRGRATDILSPDIHLDHILDRLFHPGRLFCHSKTIPQQHGD